MRYLVTLVLAWFLVSGAAQAAPTFPALTGRVVDGAQILTPATVQNLTQQLASFEQKTGHQLVVVTVPTLGGEEIEEYGVQLGRAWGIGHKDRNDGVLLIVAPKERRMRIEVGYGLEGVLTDAASSRIIQMVIVPEFKRGAMEQGIVNGARAIIGQISGDPAPTSDQNPVWILLLFAAIIFCNVTRTALYIVLMPLALLRRPTQPALFDSLEAGRKKIFARLRKIPILPLLVTFPIWMLIPVFFYGKRTYGGGGGFGGGSSGGGFSGGGGSFGGGGSSGRW